MAAIGISQMNKPAPLNYRRFVNAWIICVVPGATTFVATWGFSKDIQIRFAVALTFTSMLIKAVGIVLGNGQIYTPSNDIIDAKSK